jgi:hypothetical protein
MKNTNETIRRRLKTKPRFTGFPAAPSRGPGHEPTRRPQIQRDMRTPYAANDLLVLCCYPGMQPDHDTAA